MLLQTVTDPFSARESSVVTTGLDVFELIAAVSTTKQSRINTVVRWYERLCTHVA